MLEAGGIADQADWWVDLLSWFLPVYDMAKFASRVRQVLGGSGRKSGTTVEEKGAAMMAAPPPQR